MTEIEFDKLLRSALMEAVRLDFQPVMEAAEQEEIVFSRRYCKRREKMLQDPFAYAKKAGFPLWQRAARTVAMILLVCSLLFAVMWSVPEVRAAIRKLYMDWYENHIAVYVQDSEGTGETDLSKFHVEIPAEVLPEGYEESLREEYYGIVRYSNKANDVISVEYRSAVGLNMLETDRENKTEHQKTLNGVRYYLAEPDVSTKASQVAWVDQDHNMMFLLVATSGIGADELFEIALHIIVEKK